MSGKVLLVTGDLMFWSRVRDAAARTGATVARVDDDAGIEATLREGGVARVLVDLEVPGIDPLAWARRFRGLPAPPFLVAFGSHVDEARLRAAERAGFDVVMPRSRFHRSVEEWVAG